MITETKGLVKLSGKLSLPEKDLNRIDYIIYNQEKVRSLNLTSLLNEHKYKEIGLAIDYKGKYIFEEVGQLYKNNGLWFINGICLDYKIWDLSGETIEVVFDDNPVENFEYEYDEDNEE